MVDETVIEILTTKVSVTSGGLDFEDTLLDGQEGNIESSSSEIEDEDIALTDSLLIETRGGGLGSSLRCRQREWQPGRSHVSDSLVGVDGTCRAPCR